RSDVRGGRGRAVGGVVGRVSSADGDAADRHALGRARVFIGKTGAAVAGAQAVARHAIIRECHRRVGRAVIDFVHAGGADHQRAGGDVRRRAGGGVGGVVGRVGATEADAARTYGLGHDHVVAAE